MRGAVGEVLALLGGDHVCALDQRLQQSQPDRVALREDGSRVEAAKSCERPDIQALVIAERP